MRFNVTLNGTIEDGEKISSKVDAAVEGVESIIFDLLQRAYRAHEDGITVEVNDAERRVTARLW